MGTEKRMPSFVLFIATGLGSGYCPAAPGTAGTAVGIFLYWGLSSFSASLFILTIIALFFLGIWSSHHAALEVGQKDPSCVVIDEIIGYQVTMALIPWSWPHALMGFALFRFFDILKPFPAGWVDKNVSGGWGIVLDDVVAGVYANLLLQGIVLWIS